MLPTLILAATLLAPPPEPIARPVPPPGQEASPAPRFLELKPRAGDGLILVVVNRQETVKQNVTVTTVEDGVPVTKIVTRDSIVSSVASIDLREVKGLTIFTADGKAADKTLAMTKLLQGGVVVVSADGETVDPKYLKLLRDDTFVFVAKELVPSPPAGLTISRRPLPAQIPPPQRVPDQPAPAKKAELELEIPPPAK